MEIHRRPGNFRVISECSDFKYRFREICSAFLLIAAMYVVAAFAGVAIWGALALVKWLL